MSLKFSIVVPSYNQADTIGQTLDSLIAQQVDVDLEIIVIDGGSDSDTIDEITKREGFLSYWVSEPDQGQTDALIKGFDVATGGIYGWLNSDDILLPGSLKAVASKFDSDNHLDLVYGDMLVIDRENKIIKQQREMDFDIEVLLWVYNYIPQPSTFWTKKIYNRVGGLDRYKQCAMDFDLWMKMLKVGGKFEHIDQYLSCFRFYEEQKNQRYRKISDLEDQEIRDNYLSRNPSQFEVNIKRCLNKTRRVIKRFTSGKYTSKGVDKTLYEWIKKTPVQDKSQEITKSKAA